MAKPLMKVCKSDNISKKYDFAMERNFTILPITLMSIKKTPLKPYNSIIFNTTIIITLFSFDEYFVSIRMNAFYHLCLCDLWLINSFISCYLH